MTPPLPSVEGLPDAAPRPGDVLDRVAQARATADEAERALLVLAVEWAAMHPDLGEERPWRPGALRRHQRLVERCWLELEDPELSESAQPSASTGPTQEELEWADLPAVAWSAPASFAAANQMSTAAGKALIRDALMLAHRMPATWARVLAGEVVAWRARRVAQSVLGSPADVVAEVDAAVAPIAHSAGPAMLDRTVDQTLLRLHAEARELAQLEALEARYVRVRAESISHTGIADLEARGDWKHLHDLDQTLDQLADALVDDPDLSGLSHQVRRSVALGTLADPARALALLTRTTPTTPSEQPAPVRDRITLHVHLDAPGSPSVLGLEPAADVEGLGPVLDAAVREWCGRPDVALTVQPVIDARHRHTGGQAVCPTGVGYRIPSRTAVEVEESHPTCVFPWCRRPARACDLDHAKPFDPDDPESGGPTCRCNLLPLCRHHHNLKTHAGWTYERLDIVDPDQASTSASTTALSRPPERWVTDLLVWTDPHGRRYLHTPDGTQSLPG